MYATVFNTSTEAVPIDAEGRQAHAGDWATAETTADRARAAIDAGILVVQDDPGEGVEVDPRARDAFDRTAAIAQRAEALQALDKEVLAALAADAGVPGADDLYKPDLVAALAFRVEVAVPSEAEPEPAAEAAPAEPEQQPAKPARQRGSAKE